MDNYQEKGNLTFHPVLAQTFGVYHMFCFVYILIIVVIINVIIISIILFSFLNVLWI